MKSLKTNKTATWLTATTSDDAELLDVLIYTRYGERRLNSVGQMIEADVDKVADIEFLLHNVEWNRLWTSYVSEYNPIWNVDGTISETETRDLEANHTGTDTIAKSGSDALAKTGTVADAKTGSDTLAKTGTETLGKDGTETVAQTGTDTVTNTGTTTTQNGINGFDSLESVQAGDSVTTPDLTNTNTKNLTDTKTYDTTDTTTHNTTDTQNYNSTDTVTHNTTDTQTYNSSNTDTKNLKDTDEGTITRVTERTGNIGVTKTQELLESDRDYWLNLKSLFYENVMTDIINDICYKICVDI